MPRVRSCKRGRRKSRRGGVSSRRGRGGVRSRRKRVGVRRRGKGGCDFNHPDQMPVEIRGWNFPMYDGNLQDTEVPQELILLERCLQHYDCYPEEGIFRHAPDETDAQKVSTIIKETIAAAKTSGEVITKLPDFEPQLFEGGHPAHIFATLIKRYFQSMSPGLFLILGFDNTVIQSESLTVKIVEETIRSSPM